MSKEKVIFCGQNCSGRLGERLSVISVAGSENDHSFAKLINQLNLRNIKRELNNKYFLKASDLATSYQVQISLSVIKTDLFEEWKNAILDYQNWFAKLYGIICYKTLEPLIGTRANLHMDREYDLKTMVIASKTLLNLAKNASLQIVDQDIYIRQEKEFPSNRIIVADLFARGFFRGFDCSSNIIKLNKSLNIENEFKQVFKTKIRY